MLEDLLKSRKCFKLVCAAGNENAEEVEKLVALYSLAGCRFFDLCAKPEIVSAAKRGLERSGLLGESFLCVSVGLKGDPHVSKAHISSRCIRCATCRDICPRGCISDLFEVNKKTCIGCSRCLRACPQDAMEMRSEAKDAREILPPLVQQGIHCIELHAHGDNEEEALKKWSEINECFEGMLSVCTDRSKLSDEKLLKRVKKMLASRSPYSTIIQADGAPMSGGEDDFKSTLQSVAMAEIFQNEKLPAYLLLSGGTNSKTTELARLCDIKAHGVAIGSYARKIVKEYTAREDFFTNQEVFSKALEKARALVEVSLRHL